jgi:iron(III) transport system substrate-binding protein
VYKPILLLAVLLLLAGSLLAWRRGERAAPEPSVVVVYVSEDQVFSEPVLRAFERETGIEVRALYDTEESKSTGVVNRLLAEAGNPQADVYWANEPIRAELLRQRGVAAPYRSPSAEGIPAGFQDPQGYWTGFSARARVLVVGNGVSDPPRSLAAYGDPRWRGRGVIANPLFGTTTAQMAALFTLWGEERAGAFLEAMQANGTAISTSNGESADFVAAGQYAFSLVDSDDAVNRMRRGDPMTLLYPDQEAGELGCFIVPNVVLLVAGAPHAEAGRRLIDYLLSAETERRLAQADCAQIPLHPGVEGPAELAPIESLRVMAVDYAAVAAKMAEIQPLLKAWLERG